MQSIKLLLNNPVNKAPCKISAWILDLLKPPSATCNFMYYVCARKFSLRGASRHWHPNSATKVWTAWMWSGRQHCQGICIKLCIYGHTLKRRALKFVAPQIQLSFLSFSALLFRFQYQKNQTVVRTHRHPVFQVQNWKSHFTTCTISFLYSWESLLKTRRDSVCCLYLLTYLW